MPIARVHRVSARAPDDVSGIEAAIAAGRIDPKGVVAVLAKTEGNGLVNDFSRGFATLRLRQLFERFLPHEEAAKLCLVMSQRLKVSLRRLDFGLPDLKLFKVSSFVARYPVQRALKSRDLRRLDGEFFIE